MGASVELLTLGHKNVEGSPANILEGMMLVNSKNGLSTNDVLPKQRVSYSEKCEEAIMFNMLRSGQSPQGFSNYLKEVRKWENYY